MKYVRKAVAVILAAVFIAAVAIGFSVIFAVKNINVTVCYSESHAQAVDYSEMVTQVKEQVSDLKGKSILSVGEDDFSSLSQSGGYARFVSYKKVYPCTINITIEERLETFTCKTENTEGTYYDVYDEYGVYITTRTVNENNLDGCANILVTCGDADIADIAQIATEFKENYGALRAVVESITVSTSIVSGNTDYIFKMYCGTSLRLVDYAQYTTEKLQTLVDVFNALDDYSKTYGEVSCRANSGGQLYITLPDGTIYKV